MTMFRILVDKETFLKTSNLVTGKICIKYGGRVFPEDGWNDFVVVCLMNWMREFDKIRQKKSDKVSFWFFDGPFYLELEKKTPSDIFLSFMVDSDPVNVIFKCEIAVEHLRTTLLDVGLKVINLCKKNGWYGDDISELEYQIKILKAKLR